MSEAIRRSKVSPGSRWTVAKLAERARRDMGLEAGDSARPDLGMSAELELGDRLDLPAGTRHDADVGPRGVTCLEAHVPAGTLGELRHRPAGSW